MKNGQQYWIHENNYYTRIWSGKNGTKWKIGNNYVTAIYTPDDMVGLLKTNSWAYYNGSKFVFSTDITVKSGAYTKLFGVYYLKFKINSFT